jgi:hypothetical protein
MLMNRFSSMSRPSSNTCTMFGWLRLAASRASSMNILTKSSLEENAGRMRLTATSLSKPSGPTTRALNSSAMPPVATRSSSQ